MCEIKKFSLAIFVTLGILFFASRSFASIEFYQLSNYNKNSPSAKEYPANPYKTTTGAIIAGTQSVPILRAVVKGEQGGTTLESMSVDYTGTNPMDIGSNFAIYESTNYVSQTPVFNRRAELLIVPPVEIAEGVSRTYIIVLDVRSDASENIVDIKVALVNESPVIDGEVIDAGNIGEVKNPNPDGYALIDTPPMTAEISAISRIKSGVTVETGKIRSGSSGNQIVFECTADETMGNGSAIRFTVPDGWPSPQRHSGQEAYTSVKSNGSLGNVWFYGNTAEIPITSLAKGQYVSIYYGYGGDNSGVVAPVSTAEYNFTIRAKSADGEFLDVPGELSVKVFNAPDGSGEVTVTPSAVALGGKVALEFKYEPIGIVDGGMFSIAIPKSWSKPVYDASAYGYTKVTVGELSAGGFYAPEPEVDLFYASSDYSHHTIFVPIKKMTAEPQQFITITYSGLSQSGTSVSFPTKSKGSDDGVLTELETSPNVGFTTPPDGTGFTEANVSQVGIGTTGNEIIFTYVPEQVLNKNGAISLTVPSDWSTPRDITLVDDDDTAIGEPIFYGNTVEIPITTDINPGDSQNEIRIRYGAIGGGATASSTAGTYEFSIKSKGNYSGDLSEVENSPIEISTTPLGSGRAEITEVRDSHGNLHPLVAPGSEGNSIILEYEAVAIMDGGFISIEIPPGLPVPQDNQTDEPGYISSVKASSGLISHTSIEGRAIIVGIQALAKSGTITLRYSNFGVSSVIGYEYRFVTKSTHQDYLDPVELIDSPILRVGRPLGFPGCGTAELEQSTINAASNDNSVTIRYTADGDMTADYGCRLVITIPEGFTSPSYSNFSVSGTSELDFSGKDALIPINLEYEESIDIEYGPFSAPPTAGDYSLIVKSTYDGNTAEIEQSPKLVAGNVAAGTGTTQITQPDRLFAGSTGNTVTIEFKAIGTMDGGGITVEIPEQGTLRRSATNVNSINAQINSFSIDGQKIIVQIEKMELDDSIKVEYTDLTSVVSEDTTSSVVSEDTTSSLEFKIESSGDGKTYKAIEFNPTLDVIPFTGSTTISPTSVIPGSQGVDIFFQITLDYPVSNGSIQLDIPVSFSSPQKDGPDDYGYVSASSDGSISQLEINGNSIKIPVTTLQTHQSVSVNYKNIQIPETFTAAKFDVFVQGGENWAPSKIDSPSLTGGTIREIEIIGDTWSTACKGNLEFSLQATDEHGKNFDLPNSSANWLVEPESLGEIDDGNFSANKSGSGTISATLKDNSAIYYSVSITVTFGEIDHLNLTDYPTTMAAGDQISFSVNKIDLCGNSQLLSPYDVDWEVIGLARSGSPDPEHQNAYGGGELSNDGTFTAENAGKCQIKVTLKDNSDIYGLTDEILIEAGEVTEFAIDPSIWAGKACTSKQFNAENAKDRFGNSVQITNDDFNWEVLDLANQNEHSIGSIDNGLFSATTVGIGAIKAVLRSNTSVVSATTDEIRITFGELAKLKFVDLPSNIAIGQSIPLTFKKVDECGNETIATTDLLNEIVWSVIDNFDDKGNSVDEPRGEISDDGQFTAKYAGKCKINAVWKDNPDVFGVSNELSTNPIVSFDISPSSFSIQACNDKQFNVTNAKDEFGNNIPITNSDVNWEVVPIETIGTIDQNGNFSAETIGTGQIKASLKQNPASEDAYSSIANVTVTFGTANHLKFSNPPATMFPGNQHTFSVRKIDQCDNSELINNSEITWSLESGDEFTGGGDLSYGVFTAKYVGECKIKAIWNDISVTSEISINVASDSEIVEFAIAPSSLTIQACKNKQFNVTNAKDEFGNSVSIANSDVNWEVVSIETIGMIDQSGNFSAKTVGTGQIKASLKQNPASEDAYSSIANVTVVFGDTDRLEFANPPTTMFTKDQHTFFVNKIDLCGNSESINNSEVTWSLESGDEFTGGGDLSYGNFIAKYVGKCEIRATWNDIPGTSEILIEIDPDSEIVEFTIEPSSLTIQACKSQPLNATNAKDEFGNSIPIANSDVNWEVLDLANTGIWRSPQSTTLHLLKKNKVAYQNEQDPAAHSGLLNPEQTIGTIDQNGNFSAKTVGECQIKATAKTEISSNAVSALAEVTVTFGEIGHLNFSTYPAELMVDKSYAFSISKIDQCGNSESIDNSEVNYEVIQIGGADSPVLLGGGELSDDGVFTAKDVGDCKIKATHQGFSVMTELIKILPDLERVETIKISIEDEITEVKAGQPSKLYVYATDSYGNEFLLENRLLSWQILNSRDKNGKELDTLGIVDDGIFTGEYVGNGELEATFREFTDKMSVSVIFNREIAKLIISSPPPTIKACEKHSFSVSLMDDFGNEEMIANNEAIWQRLKGNGEIVQGVFNATIAGTVVIQASITDPNIVGQSEEFEVIPASADRIMIVEDYDAIIQSTDVHTFKASATDCAGNPVEADWDMGELIWSLSPDGDLIGEIDQDGKFTAKKVGIGSIMASLSEQPTISDQSSPIEVTPGPTVDVEIDHDKIPNEITAGVEVQFHAKGFDANRNETPADLKWEVFPMSLGELDQIGSFTPKEAGSGTVKASYSVNPEIYDEVEIKVNPSGEVEHIEIVEEGIRYRIPCGEKYTFKVQGYDAFDNLVRVLLNSDITWKASSIGSIDQNGTLTASTIANKSGKVTAEYNGMTDETDGMIETVPGDAVRLDIEEHQKIVEAGNSEEFRAVLYDEYGNDTGLSLANIDWEVSPSQMGSFEGNTFSANKVGKGRVTASYEGLHDESDELEVIPGAPVRIELEDGYPTSMRCGDTHSFEFTAYDVKDNVVVTVSYNDVDWKVENKIGSIDDDGKFTAEHTGTTKIIVTLNASNATTDLIEIDVGDLARLQIEEDYPKEMIAGEIHDFHFTAYDEFDNEIAGISDSDIKWQDDNSLGAFVGKRFTAKSIGAAQIKAEYKNSGIEDAADRRIMILADKPDLVGISATNPSLRADGSSKTQLVITINDEHGNPVKDVELNVSIVSGGGTLSVENATTDDDGTCGVEYISGTVEGQAKVKVETSNGRSNIVALNLTPVVFSSIKLKLLPRSRIFAPKMGEELSIRFTRTFSDPSTDLYIYNLAGHRVYRAVDRHRPSGEAGWFEYAWNGRKDGVVVEDGIYIYVLKIGAKVYKGTFAVVR